MDEVPFEEALRQLEAIVSRLETGDLPLEEALSVFEEGVRLTKLCSQRLNEAERRVNILVRSGESVSGELEERPFSDLSEVEGRPEPWRSGPATSTSSARSLSPVEGPALSPVEGEEEAGEA